MTDTKEQKKLHCSFCGKNQDEVKKLIAGPSVYICNECVDLCNDIIEEEVKHEESDSEHILLSPLEIYQKLNRNNLHKMEPIPVCVIPNKFK